MNEQPLPDEADVPHFRRLHPMTVLQRIIIALPGFLLLVLPLLRGPGGDSWITLALAVAYGVVAFPLMIGHYALFRYRLTPSEIIIHSGLLTRRNRSIPVERIQNIEIEQPLLARMTGTAKVKIETAGSGKTEGVLELVALEEAQHIRKLIRTYQRDQAEPPLPKEAAPLQPAPSAETAATNDWEADERVIYQITLGRVLLSGVFRFSLLYIALIFSALEYLDLDPEEIIYEFERGPLRVFADFAVASPWITGVLAVIVAAVLSWISGIAVNLNRFYGFRLAAGEEKLRKKSGLLTVSEGTIPTRRVQAILFRSNPLMRRFGWWRLELQTMGLDVRQQGHQVAVPFAQHAEVVSVARIIRPVELPSTFHPVSRLHIRRTFIRYALILVAVTLPAAYVWPSALWALLSIPALGFLALEQYRNHGYAVDDTYLYVRRGVLRHYVWAIPIDRFQVFYASASLFQRRLGLKSVYVDTAGAGSLTNAEIIDLPAAEADRLYRDLYLSFALRVREIAARQGASRPTKPVASSQDVW